MRHAATMFAAAVGLVGVLVASSTPATANQARTRPDDLGQGLAAAVRTAGFDELVDFETRSGGLAQPARALPNVDVAVLELDRSGRVTAAANVLYDRDSPQGFNVSLNHDTLQTQRVQFSRWRLDRWDDQAAWDQGPAQADVLVQPGRTDKAYMASYPASVLKLMVGYGVLRLVDRGELSLGSSIRYHTVDGQSCDYGPSNPAGSDPPPSADGATDTLAGWFDQMITVSDNFATCVLLQTLHDHHAIASTNQHFADLGLATLRMEPSKPAVGSGWSSGTMSMGALDTAKLLLILNGRGHELWRAPSGKAVTASDLSPSSRRFFLRVLHEQSFHEVLDPVALCGSTDAVQGIPARVPDRWIDPDTGHVVTYDGDLQLDFGYDVRPCNADAEVTFAHKTGLTYNAGSDAGIVRALPGKGGRWYIVAVLSNVGNRFGDPDWASADPNACEDAPYVCYPRAFGRLGASIDQLVRGRLKHPR